MRFLFKKDIIVWVNCCTYSSDNTSSMVDHNKSLLKLIKDAQGECPQKIFLILADLARSCAQKVVDALFMQDDDFFIDLFDHFKGSVKRKLH